MHNGVRFFRTRNPHSGRPGVLEGMDKGAAANRDAAHVLRDNVESPDKMANGRGSKR